MVGVSVAGIVVATACGAVSLPAWRWRCGFSRAGQQQGGQDQDDGKECSQLCNSVGRIWISGKRRELSHESGVPAMMSDCGQKSSVVPSSSS